MVNVVEVARVRFEAFKSLYDVSCDLDRFTVLTGPNGAGKSNLVDALNFLGEVYADGIEFAVGRAGGYDNVAHRRTRRAKRNVGLTVEAVMNSEDLRQVLRGWGIAPHKSEEDLPKDFSLRYKHSFSLGTASRSLLSDFVVRSDSVNLFDQEGAPLLTLLRTPEATIDVWTSKRARSRHYKELFDPFNDARYVKFMAERPLAPTALLSDQLMYGPLYAVIRRALSRTRVFQLSPYQCRTSGVPTPNAVLERHGENMPGAADHLRRNDEPAWARVQEAMRSILPDLLSIDVVYTEDRRLALQFREKGVGRAWNAGEVSDGTIQALALFIALYDSRTPLLVIEEPENSVHPWILRQFLDLCADADAKQIVVTSHSPVLLNYVKPSSVRLMSISNGRSRISRLLDAAPELRQLVLEGQLSVFDAYDSGALPEALPRGFASEFSSAQRDDDEEDEGDDDPGDDA
jgi:predicted ATPase